MLTGNNSEFSYICLNDKYNFLDNIEIMSFTETNDMIFKDKNGKIYLLENNGEGVNGIEIVCLSDLDNSAIYGKKIDKIYFLSGSTLITDTDGNLYGLNSDGQVTSLTNDEGTILYNKKIEYVYMNYDSIYVLDNNKKLYCLFDENNSQQSMPICINNITGSSLNGKRIKEVSSLGKTKIVIDDDDKIYLWGDNSEGQLGDGTTNYSDLPICLNDVSNGIFNNKKIESAFFGDETTFIIDNQGKLYSCGAYTSILLNKDIEVEEQPICLSDTPESLFYNESFTEVNAHTLMNGYMGPYMSYLIFFTNNGDMIYMGWSVVG